MRGAAAVLLVAAAALPAACATAPTATTAPAATIARRGEAGVRTAPGAPPFAALAARFTDRALEQVRAGDLRRARDSWSVVAALRPDAAEPKRQVEELTARLAAEASRRYRDGLSLLQEGKPEAARRELLLALAAEPDHAAALVALNSRLDPDAVAVTTAPGDSFASLAKRHYGDAGKAALVARVNGLDPGGAPAPGTVLLLPDLALPAPGAGKRAAGTAETPSPPSPAPSTAAAESPLRPEAAEEQFARAREFYDAGAFTAAATAAERIAGNPAVGKRARELAGDAWFAAGDAALKEERLPDALAAFRKAEPVRRDAAALIATVERLSQERAEEHYNAGVRFFINQRLDAAIRSWERALALNPAHPNAPKDIEKARELQQKLREIR